MKEKIESIVKQGKSEILEAKNLKELDQYRVQYLGKKGEITSILKSMGGLSVEEKKELGKFANDAKAKIANLIEDKKSELKKTEYEKKLLAEKIDVTEPGKVSALGALHPITVTINEISDIFRGMGFSIADGPEIETVFNNFDALNAEENHPARAETDTFYIDDEKLLRTQTSTVQIRTLMKEKPPIKIISAGRCFRCDTPDATHSPMFHQIEGMCIDEGITMADLKGTLDHFAKELFGDTVKTKFRAHHFPFTEPSAEMDMSCFKCHGEGCNVCKGSGWIEILGCGMIHPNVLKVGNVDVEKYTGFAFGMGIERIAMLKYGIEDIRLFYENDVNFIGQFK